MRLSVTNQIHHLGTSATCSIAQFEAGMRSCIPVCAIVKPERAGDGSLGISHEGYYFSSLPSI